MTFSDHLQGHDYWTSNNSKMVQQIELYLQWPTNRTAYMLYRTAPFSMTLNDPYPNFKVTLFFWRWIAQKRHEIQTLLQWNTNRDLRRTQRRHLEWSWVSLNDLAKYSMTRSVPRSLCDSWASCISRCRENGWKNSFPLFSSQPSQKARLHSTVKNIANGVKAILWKSSTLVSRRHQRRRLTDRRVAICWK